MKFLILPLLALSGSAFADQALTKSEKGEVELMLAEAASKLIYLDRDCGRAVNADKFQELAKIKAFSEGYMSIEGISWDHVKREAHIGYGSLKMKAPMGEFCAQYKVDIKDSYEFLKEI